MKILLLILFIAYLALPVNAKTILTGEVDYNVNSAKKELIKYFPQKVDSNLLLIRLKDNNYSENISAILKGNIYLTDRILAKFSDNSYAIMHKNDELHVWYYSPTGDLTYYEVKSGINYPYKSYKYNINKQLVNMGLRVSESETFIYTPSGKLIAHWIKSNGYDEDGNIIMTRKYFE